LCAADTRSGRKLADVNPSSRRESPALSEDGFGIVEIVVSMFLLGILAIAFLPLLIQSLKISSTNATIATATQLVDRDLELFREQPPTCEDLTDFAALPVAAVNDPRGQLQPHRSAGACPATYPGTVIVTTWVMRSGESGRLAEAATRILVTAAS
jgi:type II secretory pathway pseudopilin PulG